MRVLPTCRSHCVSPAAPQVMEEVRGGLQSWVDKDRWTELGIRQQVADSSYKWAY